MYVMMFQKYAVLVEVKCMYFLIKYSNDAGYGSCKNDSPINQKTVAAVPVSLLVLGRTLDECLPLRKN